MPGGTEDAHGGRGAECTFEVVGCTDTGDQTYAAARRGGTVVLVGSQPQGATRSFSSFEHMLRGKQLLGSYYGSAQVRRDFPRFVRLIGTGLLDVRTLVSRTLAAPGASTQRPSH